MIQRKVESLDTPELAIYKTLRDNQHLEDNSFIADSPKVVNMLLQTDIEVKSILATKEYYDEFSELINSKNIPIQYIADKKLMESIVGHKIHHNCMMHGIRPKQTELEKLDNKIIMVDEISSTQNIGSIARSAAALGVKSFLLPKQGPHPYNRRALRVSMGHISKLNYKMYENVTQTITMLKKLGYTIFGAEITQESEKLRNIKIPEKWVLIMGHEEKGLSQEIIDLCDTTVMIEMDKDIKSLNVSVAASILMYNFVNINGIINS